jgi:DNA-nicking Smr family endonuclease
MNKEDDREAIFSFIEKNGVYDKDASASKKHPAPEKTCRKHSIRMVLDLHGMNSRDAASKVRSFITQSRKRGLREILVIHGKGNHSADQGGPVLKKMVRDLLENELHHTVRNYRSALPREGGEGATVVYLK